MLKNNRIHKMRFEKISYNQFCKDYDISMSVSKLLNEYAGKHVDMAWKKAYNDICLPRRATSGSCGYDFYSTINIVLNPGESIKIPTCIRVIMPENIGLFIFPRSGLGFKFRVQLDNTVGIIDSDYAKSDNEGHIFVKITNDSNEGKKVNINKGEAFAQGVFIPYYITENDNTNEVRNGGF